MLRKVAISLWVNGLKVVDDFAAVRSCELMCFILSSVIVFGANIDVCFLYSFCQGGRAFAFEPRIFLIIL